MERRIRIHLMLAKVRTLGPFERFCIWTQGCQRQCRGCMTPEAQDVEGGEEIAISEVVRRALHYPGHEGVTISGGEPFLQAKPLAELIDALRVHRDMGVIVYTGYTLEQLKRADAPEGAADLLARVDLLIDGPYIEELNDGGSLRGSSNQRVIPITGRYKEAVRQYGVYGERRMELHCLPDGYNFVGVPSAEELKKLRQDAHQKDENRK